MLFAAGFAEPGIWVIFPFLVIGLVFHLVNLTREEGLPHTEFDFQMEPLAIDLSGVTLAGGDTPADRLRGLYQLHEEGLLTDDEFLSKRETLLAGTGDTPADRLRDLDQLHEEGLLTDDEFLAKREAILAAL